jgi:hypothetical protein
MELYDLSNEILAEIMSYFNGVELVILRLVSTLFYKIIEEHYKKYLCLPLKFESVIETMRYNSIHGIPIYGLYYTFRGIPVPAPVPDKFDVTRLYAFPQMDLKIALKYIYDMFYLNVIIYAGFVSEVERFIRDKKRSGFFEESIPCAALSHYFITCGNKEWNPLEIADKWKLPYFKRVTHCMALVMEAFRHGIAFKTKPRSLAVYWNQFAALFYIAIPVERMAEYMQEDKALSLLVSINPKLVWPPDFAFTPQWDILYKYIQKDSHVDKKLKIK